MNTFTTKQIVATGVGAAVFIILSRFAAIPTGVPNTSIETSYAFLAFMAILFGPVTAGLIGLIGHALKDAILYGSPWWSWVIVSGFVGFGIGLVARRINIEAGGLTTKGILLFNVTQAIVQAIGWILIAPVLDILIYAEPANKVFVQGAVAATSNILTVGVIGTLLLVAYANTRSKAGSLKREA
ncbi:MULTISPECIES: ECF-type riboflavin transporter substrate-binding protein [Exiguobacterium]|uniref:ECF-type riboflavin transporter substrate-binding protein n=1 Tax=Exiguobacterium TaxID=33986 RepID=UPI000DEF301B|nr:MULTISPECIES: ECF-type riboflavin transporter substrate-binding protein [unclassified Exiguobacterium]RHB46646.1 ECF-type riboflavin transporter substrate-binding protein [Exiguobacterium sp. AM39-5BH]TCI67426.1 ECF-type riboflavin transporter substrate-binding protein [Exiguobacterium sp. IPCI3]TCI76766.1 ECF-type riboflavin transporter substrate-binding protein [Exiguobacterium sp. IPCH1]TCI78511.1 ECF-type riboflavin transporter substrate-binding protein [Exiguobacterium sp. IPBC4]